MKFLILIIISKWVTACLDDITAADDPFNLIASNEECFEVKKNENAVFIFGSFGKSMLISDISKDEKMRSNNEWKRVLPTRFTGDKLNKVYYDFPEFGDERKLAGRTATSYFTSQILRKVHGVKIVLVLKFRDFEDFFYKWVEYINEMISTENYEVGVHLLIVQEEGRFGGSINATNVLPDVKTLKNISSRLEVLRNGSHGAIKNLLTTLIEQKGKNYKKIVLLTEDDDAKKIFGDIEKNEFVQVKRIKAWEINVDKEAGNWSKIFDEMFTSHLRSGIERIFDYYESKASNYTDISDLKKYFDTENATLINLIKITTNEKTEKFTEPFLKFVAGINTTKDDPFVTLRRESQYVNFFHKLNYNKTVWIGPLSNLRQRINGLNLWHNFVAKVHVSLSNYTIAKTVANAAKSRLDISTANSVIDWMLWKRLMDLDFLIKVRKLVKTHWMNARLVEVIKPVFNSQVSINCTKEQLTVKGPYIFMSYIPKCPALRLVIFCTNILFFDVDYFRTEDYVYVYVIAPKWVVAGDRKIKLGGAEGYSQKNRTAYKEYAKPGGPGGAGGYFYGSVIRSSDLSLLTVDVRGGRGGKGQEGYKGAKSPSKCDAQPTNWTRKPCPDLPIFKNCSFLFFYVTTIIVSDIVLAVRVYTVQPSPDNMKGGPGGPYGDGGLGGSPGMVRIDYLENDATPLTSLASKGPKGAHGECGKGGEGLMSFKYLVHTYCFKLTTYYSPKKLGSIRGVPGNTTCLLNRHDPPLEPKPTKLIPKDQIISYVKEYREYLLSSMNYTVDQANLIENYLHLSHIPDIHTEYNIQNVLDEFEFLEKHKVKSAPYGHLYEELLSHLENYTQSNKLNASTRAYIAFVYTAISATTARTRSASSGILLVHIDEYVDLIKKSIKYIKKTEGIVTKQKEFDTFAVIIDGKIEEVQNLIEKDLLPSIEVVLRNKAMEVDKTAGDILEATVTENKKLLEDKKNKLQSSLIYGLVAGAFKSLALFLNCIPVYVQVVSAASSGAEIIVGRSKPVKDVGKPPNVALAKKNFELCQTLLDDFVQSRKNGCLQYFRVVEKLFQDHNVSQLGQEFEKLAAKAKEITNDTKPGKKLDEFHDQIKSFVTHMQQSVKTRRRVDFFKATDDAEKISSLTRIIGNFSANITGNLAKAKVVKRELEKIDDRLLKVKEMYRYVTGSFRDLVNQVGEGLKNATKQSKIFFTLAKTKNMLAELKNMIFDIVSGLDVYSDIYNTFYQFNDAMNSIFSLYDTIDNYKDQKEMVRLMNNISKTSISSIFSKNATRREEVYELDKKITVNCILRQYETVMNIFQQFYFPFAPYFLTELEQADNMASSAVSAVTAKTLEEIDKISRQLHENYNIIIHELDQHTHQQLFRKHPFFIWDNEHYGAKISQFLQGNEICLYADVRWQRKNAVRFNMIDLVFALTKKFESNSKEMLAFKNLESFYVQLIHSGNSYYRCADKFYKSFAESQTFQFSIKKDARGEPVHKNLVYKKLKTDYFILSPYTLWRLQLIDDYDVGFDVLAPLIRYLDISLVGHAQYLSVDSEACKRNLSLFYVEENLE